MSKLTDVETELRKIAEYTKDPAQHASKVCELAADIVHNAGWNNHERKQWETWAKEVCEDFKIPYDNHPLGLRLAITKCMADRLSNAAVRDDAKRHSLD